MNVDRSDSGHVDIQSVESVAGQWPNPATFYGNANIVNGVLAFGILKVRCDGRLTCVITLFDDQNSPIPVSGQASWAPPDASYPDPEIQYLQFSDLPRRADGGELANCAYQVSLTYEVLQHQQTDGMGHKVPDLGPFDPGMEITLFVYRG